MMEELGVDVLSNLVWLRRMSAIGVAEMGICEDERKRMRKVELERRVQKVGRMRWEEQLQRNERTRRYAQEKGEMKLEPYADGQDGAGVRLMMRGDCLPVRLNECVQWKYGEDERGDVHVERKRLKSMCFGTTGVEERRKDLEGAKEERERKIEGKALILIMLSMYHGNASPLRTLDIIEDESNADRRMKASGLKDQVANFQFLLMLNVMLKIVTLTELLTQCLQKSSLHAKASIDLIEESMLSSRVMVFGLKRCFTIVFLWLMIMSLLFQCEPVRRVSKLPSKFSYCVSCSTSSQRNDVQSAVDAKSVAKDLCQLCVQAILSEMQERFNDQVMSFLKAFGALEPRIKSIDNEMLENPLFLSSEKLVAIVNFYQIFVQKKIFLLRSRFLKKVIMKQCKAN
ncbi:hypothetical protein CAPTEDRAFT_212249 [Capitella teleta]|uniref:Uncharacterized protein n=1 Tax=Capitella teleta TaxID=283909 RepID=R7TRU1_CAPTE|nr:hypothetical protein CAPTEDRAFT_212249 [Capitella teleta]|eukprot:ELT93750.1 hypothetical protein CAPTEDRAFT_212249 [Capitella teleta]